MNPKYPIYIISKGRYENPLTANYLDEMGVPYKIVIEPSEENEYKKVIDSKKILILPWDFSKDDKGSIPVRNWVQRRSKLTGDRRHWILDDNIRGFFRINRNLNVPVSSGTIFKVAEDFVDRYENVKMAGFNYFMFIPRKEKIPPYYLNTRIYSCILLDNTIPFEWRGRYNEDTDLSLRILKRGWCTILFNAFNCDKQQTMTMKGGNEEIYNDSNGRIKFVESLIKQHPDVVKLTWKFGRWHHQVDYSRFKKNKLIRKKSIDFSKFPKVDNYGMKLIKLHEEEK